MYHSITIGDKNTWDDWKMIPSSRPVVAPPVEKVVSVDVPGRDGTTYLSNSLTGYPVFKSREGTWEFYLDTDALRGNNLSSPIGAGALDHLSRILHKGNATPGQVRVRPRIQSCQSRSKRAIDSTWDVFGNMLTTPAPRKR